MKLLKWFLINAVFGFCLYMGTYQGVEGYENMAIAIIICNLICTIGVVQNKDAKAELKPRGRFMETLNSAINAAYIGTMVYFGWWFMACIYGICFLYIVNAKIENSEKEDDVKA